MSDNLNLPILPLDDTVVLPGMVVPVPLGETEIRAAVDAARAARTGDDDAKGEVLLVPRLERQVREGRHDRRDRAARPPARAASRSRSSVAPTGCASDPVRPDRVRRCGSRRPSKKRPPTRTTPALAREYKALAVTILQQRGAYQFVDNVQSMTDPSLLADLAGYAGYLNDEQKVWLLETVDVSARLTKLLEWGREHLAELDVAETIRKDVQEGMDKQQREFLLRKQLAAVRKELSELDGSVETEEQDYRARVEAADLPEKVKKAALTEVDKLERTSEQSPEVGWIRTWLDTVLEMPWNERTDDAYDVAGAREILDADHAGLSDVKDRIIEYLAVRRRRADRGLGVVGGRRSGAVLALVGPPGVGKTSLGESVARAMGRKFVRVALGGVRDEAEIRGHRRTYVGAMPGRIVRAIKEAGSMNPVVLLDEVDKVGADYRGDPTAALLEVLDPAQNHTFRDHYLEVELDLSDVLFLATANVLDSIPGPLLDRMELIRLDGYTEDEKLIIGRDHLLPRQLDRAGLTPDEVTISDEALRKMAAEYSHEAGVRDLERLIARALRKVTAKAALEKSDGEHVAIDEANLVDYLGRPEAHAGIRRAHVHSGRRDGACRDGCGW